jgi:capsule polysaccharide modification protein KpsS
MAGYYTELVYKLAQKVKEQGFNPIIASTSPFYERYKNVDLQGVAKIYYLSDFLKKDIPEEEYSHIEFNLWDSYPTYDRQYHFLGKYNNKDVNIYRKTHLYFQRIFQENPNIKVCVCEGVSSSFIYIAYREAQKNNIMFFGYMAARLPNLFSIHTDIYGHKCLPNHDYKHNYAVTNEPPDYMKNSRFGSLLDNNTSILTKFKKITNYLGVKTEHSLEIGNNKAYFMGIYKWYFKRLLADWRYRKFSNIFEKDITFDPKKKYLIYPLHFHPEASTSVLSRHYFHELEVIRNIAFSLPNDAILVVKEHKANVGNNNKKFYRQISSFPQTILLDPYYPLGNILTKFDAVVTLTSTMGYEALAKGLPVYILGEVFYDTFPGAVKVESFKDLEEKIKNISKNESKDMKDEILNLYIQKCFSGNFNLLSPAVVTDDNINKLTMPLFHYLHQLNKNSQEQK